MSLHLCENPEERFWKDSEDGVYDPNPMDFYEVKGRQPREVFMVLAKGRDMWPKRMAEAMHGIASIYAGKPKTKGPPKPRLRTMCQVFLTRATAMAAYARALDWAERAHGPGHVSPDDVRLFRADLNWEEVVPSEPTE